MMKKTLLALSAIVATAFVAVACDTGGARKCTADTQCAEDEICQIDADAEEGLCSVFSPICAADVDCDLANSASPSVVIACTDAASCSTGQPDLCRLEDNSDFCECVSDGVGETYCVGTPGADQSCGVGSPATADGKAVCLVDANETCDVDGQCVANN